LFCPFRCVFLPALAILLAVRVAQAAALSPADMDRMRSAVTAADKGKWSEAYSDLAPVKDPLPLKILRWLDYTHTPTNAGFAEIAQFIKDNPDWPQQKLLRLAAERAIADVPDAVAAAWLKRYPPLGFAGKVRLAETMIDMGDVAGGTAALRSAWIDCDFGPADEKSFLARHGGAIRQVDDIARLDRLLWDGQFQAARRMLPRVPPDYRVLAAAREALANRAPNAEAALAKVPAQLRSDPGLLFDELRWQRKNGMLDAAVPILLAEPGNPVHPDRWWRERAEIARQLLAQGNAALAYRIVEQHGPVGNDELSQAEFLAGYIALRFMKNPSLAFDHFSRILARATAPDGRARAGFWGGRAAAAEGKPDLAQKWYAAGAEDMATFYGQLAAHQLGDDAPPHPVPEPQATAAERAQFDQRQRVRAAEIFFALGDRYRSKAFLLGMADTARTPVDFAMLASLAEANGRIDLAISVAKRALMAEMPLMVHGYPVIALPAGGTTEHALLYAIIRQESAFETDALSPAGALGLMQLMPATAKFISKKEQLPFSPQLLTSDGSYNVQLGRAYLERLLDDFGGSYALAIAAYNAGPGRVREWLREYGDPRGGQVNMIDWIEILPFAETRRYVQRVLENLQIYRGRDGAASAFSLVSDLAR
jgi:soluble lytic murein transglycosylase